MPARLLLLVRLSQRLIETLLAHAARLTALAFCELVTAGRAPKLNSGRKVTLSVGMEGNSFRSASHAFLAEDLLALHADAGQERPRMGRKKCVGFAIAAEAANRNRSVNVGGRTTVTIRAAIAASNVGCVVRDDSVLLAPGRPAYFNSFALSFRYRSIARRTSSATGAPVFSDSVSSFLICSSLRKRAVRFMVT